MTVPPHLSRPVRSVDAEPSPSRCVLGAFGFLLATAAFLYAVVLIAA